MKTLPIPPQVGGNHYGDSLQPWDLQTCMQSTGDVFIDARRTDVLEYVFRLKGDLQTLKQDALKARHNLDAIIARIDELEPPPEEGCKVMAMEAPKLSYQEQIRDWMIDVWGIDSDPRNPINDGLERCFRFFEESAELVQSLGMTYGQEVDLITYVWQRPLGEPEQEVGGVFTTLYALCCTHDMDGKQCAYRELERVRLPHIMQKIRHKHFSKPVDSDSPLPGKIDESRYTGGLIPRGPVGLVGELVKGPVMVGVTNRHPDQRVTISVTYHCKHCNALLNGPNESCPSPFCPVK